MIKNSYTLENVISRKNLEEIHDDTMDILENTGVKIFNKEALKLFEEKGAKVKDNIVYLNRLLVEELLQKTPSYFELYARNPENNLMIGKGDTVLAPGFGASFVIENDGGKRISSYEDYINFTILASASDYIDVLGGVLVEPNDIPEKLRQLKMFLAAAKYSDKCLMGSSLGAKKAEDSINMASILFNEEGVIDDRPVLISVISTNSPLQYDKRMLDALIVYARHQQPLIISSAAMAGLTSPFSLAGTLVLQNAEILFGIILSQIINPGTPVVYGSASTISDMKTANLLVGSPQFSKLIAATTQMAKYYNLPSRAGGSITDSDLIDTKAGYESMMSLLSTVNSGTDFILHSAGILESYKSMSYKKFIIDEKIISMVADYQSGIKINKDTLRKEEISQVGHGQHYLATNYTLEHMKDYTSKQVNKEWRSIIDEFYPPYLDPVIEDKLIKYIELVTSRTQ